MQPAFRLHGEGDESDNNALRAVNERSPEHAPAKAIGSSVVAAADKLHKTAAA